MLKNLLYFHYVWPCSTVGLQAKFVDLNSHKARTSNSLVGGWVLVIDQKTIDQTASIGYQANNQYEYERYEVHVGYWPNNKNDNELT